MSLWTDRPIIFAPTLGVLDAAILSVSTSEKIALEGPTGLIQQAWAEAGHELLGWMQSISGDRYYADRVPDFLGNSGANRARYLLNQVVTTGQWMPALSPLATYVARMTIEMFWRQAVRSSQKTDRFEKRYEFAQADTKVAKRRLWESGIPIVLQPLSCPGAFYEPISGGPWSSANLSIGTNPGSLSEAASVDVAITWLDGTYYLGPQQKQNGESGPSETVSIALEAEQSLLVSIDSLVAPGSAAYQGGLADGVFYFRAATHWNCYAGVSGGPLVLQNLFPVPVATKTLELTTVVTDGSPLEDGQVADRNQMPVRTFSRS